MESLTNSLLTSKELSIKFNSTFSGTARNLHQWSCQLSQLLVKQSIILITDSPLEHLAATLVRLCALRAYFGRSTPRFTISTVSALGRTLVSDGQMNHGDLDLSFSIPLSRSFSELSTRRQNNQFYHSGVWSRGGRSVPVHVREGGKNVYSCLCGSVRSARIAADR